MTLMSDIKTSPTRLATALTSFVWIAAFVLAMGMALSWPEMPTYWPAMLSAYIIATFVIIYRARKANQPMMLRESLFPKDIWLHPSTFQDLVMTILTFLLMRYLFQYLVMDPNGPIVFFHIWLSRFAMPRMTGMDPPLLMVGLYVIFSIGASDLLYYLSHRMMHRYPILWEFHKVHHSAQVLTPLTLYRIHPIDSILNQCFRNFGIGVVSGIFFYFYPSNVSLFVIASNFVASNAFHLVAANLKHSHVWISFGPLIEKFFLSPAQHQVHHSDNPKHFDKNFGSLLSFWDWIFGSLYVTNAEKENITFGIGKSQKDIAFQSSLWKMYVDPFIAFAKWIKG